MPLHIAILLGIVEGLTEYLPVSSTGHLVLVGHWLGLNDDDPSGKAFEIVVQLGAILAVLVHYRVLLGERIRGLLKSDPRALRLLSALAIAFTPAAIAGLLLRKIIKAHLQTPLPVAAALIAGGIVMIAVERWLRRTPGAAEDAKDADDIGLDAVTPGRALAIGIGQCFSLWPGTSRSMSTIVAGQLSGLSTATAAEFSFLLALPTLGAATVYEGYKSRAVLLEGVGAVSMLAGLIVSFFVAWAVIASFLKYLKAHGLEPFGWYRVVLGGLVFWILAR
jgi:undecaprenyl-diphosphatase